MGVLQRFERRIESMVNRPFAKAFKAEVQPVEVAAALQRETDDHANYVARGRTMVPNVFVVELGDHDHDRLSPYGEPLGAELADMVREHAEEQGYSFIGPVDVGFELVRDLDTGIFRIRSTALVGATPSDPGRAAPSAHSPFLEVGTTRYALRNPVTVLGRGTDVDLRLDDPGVSRRHAEVQVSRDGDRVRGRVTDLGSTNGVRVDGQQVLHAPLLDGDVFTIGTTDVVFRSGESG